MRIEPFAAIAAPELASRGLTVTLKATASSASPCASAIRVRPGQRSVQVCAASRLHDSDDSRLRVPPARGRLPKLGRGTDPEIPDSRPVPPRFGRENSRDFPDPDWAGIRNILGILPRSRFGRDPGKSGNPDLAGIGEIAAGDLRLD